MLFVFELAKTTNKNMIYRYLGIENLFKNVTYNYSLNLNLIYILELYMNTII